MKKTTIKILTGCSTLSIIHWKTKVCGYLTRKKKVRKPLQTLSYRRNLKIKPKLWLGHWPPQGSTCEPTMGCDCNTEELALTNTSFFYTVPSYWGEFETFMCGRLICYPSLTGKNTSGEEDLFCWWCWRWWWAQLALVGHEHPLFLATSQQLLAAKSCPQI